MSRLPLFMIVHVRLFWSAVLC